MASRLEQCAEDSARRAVSRFADFNGPETVKSCNDLSDAYILQRFPWWAHRDTETEEAFLEWYRAGWEAQRKEVIAEFGETGEPIRGLGVQSIKTTNGVL